MNQALNYWSCIVLYINAYYTKILTVKPFLMWLVATWQGTISGLVPRPPTARTPTVYVCACDLWPAGNCNTRTRIEEADMLLHRDTQQTGSASLAAGWRHRLNGSDSECDHVQSTESRLRLVHEVAPLISEPYPRQQSAVD